MTHKNFVDGGESPHLRCWTNYPLHKQLGQDAKSETVYVVNVLAYDGNKYVKIETDEGRRHIIKFGYLRTDAACTDCLPAADLEEIATSIALVWNDVEAVADDGLIEMKRAWSRIEAKHEWNCRFQDPE